MSLELRDTVTGEFFLVGSGTGSKDDPFIPTFGSNSVGPVKLDFFRYLSTDGTTNGTKNAIGDYSDTGSGLTIFSIQPPDGVVYRCSRIMPFIEDAGSFDSGKYGNSVVLTNGIEVRVQDDSGTIIDMTDGVPIKTNPHWKRLCYDVDPSAYGTGNEAVGVRWTFTKAGQYIRLDGSNNERLEVLLHDAFDDLVGHYFQVQGYIE